MPLRNVCKYAVFAEADNDAMALFFSLWHQVMVTLWSSLQKRRLMSIGLANHILPFSLQHRKCVKNSPICLRNKHKLVFLQLAMACFEDSAGVFLVRRVMLKLSGHCSISGPKSMCRRRTDRHRCILPLKKDILKPSNNSWLVRVAFAFQGNVLLVFLTMPR